MGKFSEGDSLQGRIKTKVEKPPSLKLRRSKVEGAEGVVKKRMSRIISPKKAPKY